MLWLPDFFYYGILQRNYQKITMKWSFANNILCKIVLLLHDSLTTRSIPKDPVYSFIKVEYYTIFNIKTSHLRNEFNFCNVHGIMNTSGLLQSKRSSLGFIYFARDPKYSWLGMGFTYFARDLKYSWLGFTYFARDPKYSWFHEYFRIWI